MDLTFLVPMQCCSLHHWTLLPSPVTSTTGSCFHFGSAPSFLLELFLCSSPVAHRAPTDLRSSSLSVLLSFCLFILFMGFLRQERLSGLPFPSPVDHVLSENLENPAVATGLEKIDFHFNPKERHLLDHRKSKRIPEKHLLLLH